MSGITRPFRTAKFSDTLTSPNVGLQINLPSPEWDNISEEHAFIRFSVQTDDAAATIPATLVTGEIISGAPSVVQFNRGSGAVDVIIRGEAVRSL